MVKHEKKVNSVNFTYKKIVSSFVVATVFLLIVISYFSLANAKIYLKVKEQPAKIKFSTQVKENVNNDNYLETNVLKGRILELTMEKTREFDVVGQESPAEKYGGMMTIYNKKPEKQPLLKRTRFQSAQGKIFRIQEPVVIPANSSIKAYVVAEEAGEDYKELPGKFILPGFKNEYSRTRVYGELKEPMEKKKMISYIITQNDLNKANMEITSDLKKDALHKLKELLVDDEQLDESSIFTEIISFNSSKGIGEFARKFKYTIKLKIAGIIFDRTELLKLAQKFIDDQLTADQELLAYNNNSLKYKVSDYVSAEKSATLDVEMSAHVIKSSKSETFNKERLQGLKQEEIIKYFSEQPAIESIKVVFSPFWVKKAPKMTGHIKIIIVK